MITATRWHDISCGHRVAGHESKCAHLHGHNYRIHFTVEAAEELDTVGRVLDFSVIKTRLCMWVEEHWDHRFLLWERDPMLPALLVVDWHGVVAVPFNPTAERMAEHLVKVVGPAVLAGTDCRLISVRIEETARCSAEYTLDVI